MKGLLLPTSKKDFKTTDVAVLTLARWMIANGCSLQEVKKELYNTINQAQCLETKSDKDARKREIKKLLISCRKLTPKGRIVLRNVIGV